MVSLWAICVLHAMSEVTALVQGGYEMASLSFGVASDPRGASLHIFFSLTVFAANVVGGLVSPRYNVAQEDHHMMHGQ